VVDSGAVAGGELLPVGSRCPWCGTAAEGGVGGKGEHHVVLVHGQVSDNAKQEQPFWSVSFAGSAEFRPMTPPSFI